MKFMLMMHGSRAGFEALAKWKPEEFHAHIRFMLDLNAKLTSSGELVLAEGLDVPPTLPLSAMGRSRRPRSSWSGSGSSIARRPSERTRSPRWPRWRQALAASRWRFRSKCDK